MEGDGKPLQPLVERLADREFDLGHGAQHEAAAQEDEQCLGDTEREDGGHAPDDRGAVAGEQRPVNDLLQHDRDGEACDRTGERDEQTREDPPLGGLGEGNQPGERLGQRQ